MSTPYIMPCLKGYRVPQAIVAYAVRVYHRFALSTADVEDLLAERSVTVTRETVRKWVNRFGCHLNKRRQILALAGSGRERGCAELHRVGFDPRLEPLVAAHPWVDVN